jgi:sec-independent protein translocase protein TatB
MLPDIGGSEILVIAIVALIVVGPKDLPVLLKKLGQFMAKLRGMASEFRASFDEMARQSELDELRKEVEAMRKGQIADIAAREITPEISQTFDDLNQSLTDAGVQLHPPMSYQYAEMTDPPPAPEAAPLVVEANTSRKRKAPAKKPAAKAAAAKATAKRTAAKSPARKPAARKPKAEGST